VKLDPELIKPERILEQFYQYAEEYLAKHRGRIATIKLNRVFGYKGFYAAHVVAVFKQNPPRVVFDAKGRTWILVGLEKRNKGNKHHPYHVLVFRRA